MIGQLKGLVEAVGADSCLIDVAGVGYVAFCSAPTLAALSIGQACTLKILTHVREDHIHLFGFADAEEKAWFDLLLSVQGVGPKMALAILGHLDPESLANALMLEDKRPFQSVSGVGPKLAARLVTELKERTPKGAGAVSAASLTAQPAPDVGGGAAALGRDLISALTNLGYDETTARTAAMAALKDGGEAASLDSLIPLALKALAP